jgi:uncharacterized protein YneF (UPF0154 family)
MKYQLTSKDVPKIVLALVLLVGSIGTFVSRSHQAQLQQENREMIKHLNRELGVKDSEFSESTEELHRERKEETEREIASSVAPDKATR